MTRSFSAVEENIARRNVERTVNALYNDIETLNMTAGDWAGRDDIYRFIKDRNADYIKTNLAGATSFAVNKLNIMILFDDTGNVVYGKGYDLKDSKELPVSAGLMNEYLKPDSPLVKHLDEDSAVSGIIVLPEGTLLVASRPVITSGRQGPVRGALVMGRYLDAAEIEHLSEITHQDFTIQSIDEKNMPPGFDQTLKDLAGSPIVIQPVDDDLVAGYTMLKDVFGKPSLMLKTVMPRDVFKQWRISALYGMVFLLATGLVFSVMMLYLLEKHILSRLGNLSSEVNEIGKKGDFSARVALAGNDELSGLANMINGMLEAIELSSSRLKESEENYRRIFDENMVGIFTSSPEGSLISCNNAFAKIIGFQSAEEAKEINMSALFQKPEDREFSLDLLRREKRLEFYELKIIRADGQKAVISENVTGVFDDHGNLQQIEGFVLDVTLQKKAAEDLEKTRARYKELVDSLPVSIFEINEKGIFSLANAMSFSMFGYSRDEYEKGLNVIDLIAPQDRDRAVENMHRVISGERLGNQEYLALRKDGTVFPMVMHASGGGDAGGLRSIVIDVSDIKRTQVALRESEEKYRTILENMEDAYFEVDLTGNITFFNDIGCKMTGYSREELLGSNYSRYTHPEDVRRVYKSFNKVYLTGRPAELFDWIVIRKDGPTRYFEATVSLVTDSEGVATGFRGLARDITERKKVLEKLRESEEKYRLVFENSPLGILHFDRYGNITACNGKIEEIVGIPEKSLIGVNILGLSEQKLVSSVKKVLSGQQSHYEAEYQTADPRRTVPVKADFAPIIIDENKVIGGVGIVENISERKVAEKQLKYLSFHDSLTGLYNRAYFEQEMRRLETGRILPVGIIVCDVDGLKLVNDTMGHDTGDALLVAAAEVISQSFRGNDVVSRIGGDEFAVLIPGGSRVVVEDAYKRIKKAIDNYNRENIDLSLSMSVGLAVSSSENIKITELFKEADNSMYREKLHSSHSARSSIVQTLMKALEARDFITEGHADRMQKLVAGMAAALGISDRRAADLRLLAQFHDIGKVGIPDRILFKPGPLTSEEWEEMKRHSEIGHRIALSAPDLAPVADWVLKHHECWDGSGYPLGLKGDEIPMECRLLAIVDAYDAMVSDRPYRKAITQAGAIKELKRCSGTQFDPDLLVRFVEMLGKIK
jgi:diguanylate cyclase (GGDEF)-like protein/PAS domain S-box-containing protein